MSFQLNVQSDVTEITKYLNFIQKRQLPIATKNALTKIALDAKKALRANIKIVFDRPKPFTVNSVFVKGAKKTHLVSIVGLKDQISKGTPAKKYLQSHITGGNRSQKRLETLLRSRGFLPKHLFIVPSKTMPLNQFGNVPTGQIKTIIAGLGARYIPPKDKRKKKSRLFFVAKIKNAFGIWERLSGNQISLVFAFVRKPTNVSIFKFERIARKIGGRKFKLRIEQELRKALATAK